MQLVLQVSEPNGQRRTLWMRLGQVARVGRGDQADYVFADDVSMSGLHFELECCQDGCFLRDLNSTNGTFLNGQQVKESRIYGGDIISAGGTTFTCEVDGGPARVSVSELTGDFQEIENVGTEEFKLNPTTVPIPVENKLRVSICAAGGSYRGKTIWLRPGQSVTIGRTDHSDHAFDDDERMSGRHFAVECNETECRIRDLGSSNGTYLNDTAIIEAALSDGDTIRAGITVFKVHTTGYETPQQPPIP